jgi:hypothetical protein
MNSELDEDDEPEFQRKRNNKRPLMNESDEDMNNELDVKSINSSKENKNVNNMFSYMQKKTA